MSSKVAAQAIGDMRPAAAGAVMASMDVTAAAAAAEAMEPSVAAAAMCSMEVHEAIACIVEMPKESRVAILESMTPEQLGALLSAMTPEDASDVLRILGTKWSILAVDNMVPGPAAAAVQMLTEERLVEMLIGISPKKAGAPLLEALEESEPGHRLAADAMTTLTNRHADRAAAHLAAMVDVAMAGTDRGVPGSGYAVARLFGDLPLTCQGLTIIRMTAKQAAYLMSWLGPDGAAKAAAAAAKAGGANGAGFCAAAAEELDAMGFAGDANDSGGSSNGSKGAKGAKGASGAKGGNGARGAAASLLAAMAKDDPAAASAALGALDPSLAASALSQLGPQAAADLASGVADPTVGAALLERMPTEKRAAMMVRMDPAASAAAASAMHPEAAAEAMDAVQASVAAASGDASGDSSGDSSGIAKRLAAMVGQMDPFAAAQALSAMSQESAASMAASLPPDRAGAIIASGGIPAEDAGAMLDALPLDAADKVMAALPPNVAEKAAAHVSSDEIKERAAARAVVHLPSSTLEGDGAERCVAGVEASFRLESANPGGGRIGRGGAIISCVMHLLEPVTHEDREDNDDVTDDDDANANAETAKTTSASRKRLSFPFPVDARCEDLGNGTYEFTYELQRAGEYQCSLQTAGHEHCVYVTCEPGALDPNSCTVEEPASLVDEPWRAGSPLEVRVNCHDTFGNPIKPPSDGERVRAPLVIVADGEGPGVVEAEVVADESNPHATWQIARFRATECGEYELRVFATETQRQWWGGMPRNNLPGAPLRLQLEPAASDPSRCRVKLSGLKERPGGMLVGMAGRDASVTVFAVDKYDNPASFGDLKLRVDAVGPADVTFRKDGSGDGTSARFFGAPERSGSYTLRVTLAGRTVSGFPRNLQVVAARTDPTRCIVRGDALEGIRVGERCKASMAAHDAFGNSCLEGGDQVMVRLLGPAGSVDADVVDYGDGSYGLSFAVPRGGVWRAHLAVNGGENPEPVAEFTASQGVLAANQTCLRLQGAHEYDGGVRPGGGSSSAPRAGSETTVYVQALDYDVSAREVSGQEPVCLRLLSPSGVSAHVPLRLAKDGARFTARVRWPEVGKHVLVASLNGDAVVGSPAQVDVVAADVHLPACKVTGVGSSKCVAGERTRFVVEARDSRGNRLLAGGASLLAAGAGPRVRAHARERPRPGRRHLRRVLRRRQGWAVPTGAGVADEQTGARGFVRAGRDGRHEVRRRRAGPRAAHRGYPRRRPRRAPRQVRQRRDRRTGHAPVPSGSHGGRARVGRDGGGGRRRVRSSLRGQGGLAGTRFTCGAGTSATPSGARRSTSTSSPGKPRVHRASRSSRGPSWRVQASSPPSPANPSRFACKRGTGSATPPRGSAGRPSASPRPARRTWCSPRRWSRTTLMLTWATGAHPDAASSPPCCTEPERTSCGAPWAAKPSWDGHVSSRWYPGRPRRTRRSGARRLRPWRSPRRSHPTAPAVIR
jgi:flagellar motility protein MotE (MotC chaperone)